MTARLMQLSGFTRLEQLDNNDRRAALLLGAARELTNLRAGHDTQNTSDQNAVGHFLGALAEASLAKWLQVSSQGWAWTEPLRLEGGAATGGPSKGDFIIPTFRVSADAEPAVEVKSIFLGKRDINLNLRKLVRAIDAGVVWLPVVLCPSLSHSWAAPVLRPIDSLLQAALPNRDRGSADWTWRQARFHPQEFGQSYLTGTTSTFASSEGRATCARAGCRDAAGLQWLDHARKAVPALRRTDPARWPESGVEELVNVTSYEQFLAWWRRCRNAVTAGGAVP